MKLLTYGLVDSMPEMHVLSRRHDRCDKIIMLFLNHFFFFKSLGAKTLITIKIWLFPYLHSQAVLFHGAICVAVGGVFVIWLTKECEYICYK